MTQLVADRIAAGIAEHPEDWHMLQRMWLDESQTAAVSAG
jgi:KDO2-lipid IV(A) lauroyltransferase